jgi:putative addiction module CopG family antidote
LDHSRTRLPADVEQFVQAKVQSGRFSSAGEAITAAMRSLRQQEEAKEARALEGIRQGLDDVRAGRTQPLAEAFADIRRDLSLPGVHEIPHRAGRDQFPPDLQALVGEQMASGKYESEDELLRSALRALAEEEQDLDAVRESLAEWQADDLGVPHNDAFDAIRGELSGAQTRTVSPDLTEATDNQAYAGKVIGAL